MKTAIQELEDKLKDNLKWIVLNADYELMDKLFIEAIEKEKEQIVNAYLKGDSNGCGCYDFATPMDADNYYNETYKR
jgi:hypothetical protein